MKTRRPRDSATSSRMTVSGLPYPSVSVHVSLSRERQRRSWGEHRLVPRSRKASHPLRHAPEQASEAWRALRERYARCVLPGWYGMGSFFFDTTALAMMCRVRRTTSELSSSSRISLTGLPSIHRLMEASLRLRGSTASWLPTNGPFSSNWHVPVGLHRAFRCQ